MSPALDVLVVDDERPALEDLGRLLRSLKRVGGSRPHRAGTRRFAY
jgi:hypothetical protein